MRATLHSAETLSEEMEGRLAAYSTMISFNSVLRTIIDDALLIGFLKTEPINRHTPTFLHGKTNEFCEGYRQGMGEIVDRTENISGLLHDYLQTVKKAGPPTKADIPDFGEGEE